MKRIIFFVVLLLVGSAFYINAMRTIDDFSVGKENLGDSTYNLWLEKIIDSTSIPYPAFNLALNGLYDLKMKGLLTNDSLVTIVDFSKSSEKRRLFILDIKNKRVIKNTYVAHGKQSGTHFAESFSNSRFSNKSSLGLYVTNETYIGKHGYSLRIEGVCEGLNNNARNRAVVIHGAEYVSEQFIKATGRLGRSLGCPALPVDETDEIIDLIKDGSCLLVYHPTLIPISQAALERLP